MASAQVERGILYFSLPHARSESPGVVQISAKVARQLRGLSFFGATWKTKVFGPRSLPELSQPITTVITSITRYILYQVWDELDYRLDNHRVSYAECIESLRGVCKTARISPSVDVGVKYVIRLYFLYHFETLKFFCGPPVLYFPASLESRTTCYTMVSHSGNVGTAQSYWKCYSVASSRRFVTNLYFQMLFECLLLY